MKKDISAIILAAGKGTRMAGSAPKVLTNLCDQPMLSYVLKEVQAISPHSIHIVVGYKAQDVMNAFPQSDLRWHTQEQQKGTANAVDCALGDIKDDQIVFVTYGDMPLLQSTAYQRIINAVADNDFVLLTTHLECPDGYGRIQRDENQQPIAIVEQADATEQQLLCTEVNVGVVATKADVLRSLIAEVDNDNQQKEYYLTDCLAIAARKGLRIATVVLQDASQACGVNNMLGVSQAERLILCKRARQLSEQALVKDISRIDVRGNVNVGEGVVFDVGVILEGDITVGDNVYIGPYTVLKDVTIGDGSKVEAFSYIERASVGKECRIGPYARLRPDASIGDEVCIGNFVEIKKSRLANKSKVNHLSYIGDSEIGSDVNVGAGTITCNYDGANKHQTVIEDNVFIGSNTALIAPVKIGQGATIGAGSTISQDVSPDTLAVSRAKQESHKGWKRPNKDKK